MLISKSTPLNVINILQPRYYDRKILPATYKVKEYNKIIIEEGAYQGEYYLSGKDARKYPVTTNGKIAVYQVPVTALEPLEYKEDLADTAKDLFDN